MANIKIYIPTFVSDQNFNPARVNPRLFFYNGKIDCEPFLIEANEGGTISQTSIPAFPYFDHYSVEPGGTLPGPNSKSLLFLNENTPYGTVPTASLYDEYWEKYVSLLYDPATRLLDASAIISLGDYNDMELNDVVQFRGNYYHLRAINEYDVKDGTCKIQLLGPILGDAVDRTVIPINCEFDFTAVNYIPPTTTTTTSTTQPLANTIYYVAEGGEDAGGVLTYTDVTGSAVTQSLAAEERKFFGAVSASVSLTGVGSQTFAATQTLWNTSFVPLSSGTEYQIDYTTGGDQNDRVVFYVPLNGTELTYEWLENTATPQTVYICSAYSSSFQIQNSLQNMTVTEIGSCVAPTTTTTTSTTSGGFYTWYLTTTGYVTTNLACDGGAVSTVVYTDGIYNDVLDFSDGNTRFYTDSGLTTAFDGNGDYWGISDVNGGQPEVWGAIVGSGFLNSHGDCIT
jgi:hypothetical protein